MPAIIKWLLYASSASALIACGIWATMIPYVAILEAVVEAFRHGDREWYANFFLSVAGILLLLVVIIIVGNGYDEYGEEV